LLAAVVSLVAPRAGYGQNGNGNGQQPQNVRAFDAPRQAYDSRLQLSFDDGHNVTGGEFDPVPRASSSSSPLPPALLI